MAIKNYRSEASVYESLGKIQGALAKAGASKIMVDYDAGKPMAVSFALPTPAGTRGFVLPAAVEGTLRVFQRQKLKLDRAQAEITAWANIRDWVLAQLALIESCDVPVDQVFLPYLSNGHGKTLYDVYASGQLQLGDGGGTNE
ncbi:MAG: hypothetical protein VB058_05865 [Oscillospiraceae bacterium]|nr:hypothetical protein [Oscillospiraceae bacterium]